MLVRKLEEKKEDLKILNSPKFIKIIEKKEYHEIRRHLIQKESCT